MKPFILIPLVAASLMAGCASPPPQGTQTGRKATVAGTALGAAGGAYLGSKSSADYGAPLGALAGAAVGYVAGRATDSARQKAVDEAYEAGRREAAAKTMQAYWDKNAVSVKAREDDTEAKVEVVYPAGVYEGVRMLPHAKDLFDGGNTEPRRK